jgi:hypothetical protein
MAQVPYQSFYLGPFAVYTSPTGMTDPITGVPYLGGSLHEGDYCDLTAAEAAQWNQRFGSNLFPGRLRFVRISGRATAANIGFGKPAGFGLGQSVAQVVVSAAGSSATTDGTYTCSSTAAGGTAATALVTVSGGAVTGAQLIYGGANMTSVPTFGLTEIAGLTSASVLAQMADGPNFISSFDASCAQLSTVRGVFLTKGITAAQITAGAWGVIQEQGVANILVTTATGTPAGSAAAATTGAVVTTTAAATSRPIGYFADTLDLAAASTIIRGVLQLPVEQG